MTAVKRQKAPPVTDAEEARIQVGIAADPDNPELTDEQLAQMRPGSEVLPAKLFAAMKRRRGERGPSKRARKVQVTLRVDPEALEAFRATGPGWQTRISEAIREAAKKVA